MDTMTRAPRDIERRPRPSRWPLLAAVLAGLMVVVGVAFLLRPTSDVTTASPPVAQPAPAPAVTPTTLAAPALLNTGADPDWPVLVRSLLSYRDWMLTAHPDPALVANFLDPSYRVAVVGTGEVSTYSSTMEDVVQLQRGDIRYEPAPAPTVAEIVTMQNRDDHSASVFVRFAARKGTRFVGRDGTVTQSPDSVNAAVIWRLVLGADGRWRLAGVKAP